MKQLQKRTRGFTLIEMLLVSVLIGVLMVSGMTSTQQRTQQAKIDRTILDMQQILNAALSHRLRYSVWPPSAKNTFLSFSLQCLSNTSVAELDVPSNCDTVRPYSFMPWGMYLINPWGELYVPGVGANPKNYTNAPVYYIWTSVTQASGSSNYAASTAAAIAGALPLSYTTTNAPVIVGTRVVPPLPAAAAAQRCRANSTRCYVVAGVNRPGESLNAIAPIKNPNAMGFAGLYHHGGCVPVPTCPISTDIPQVYVVPASVSGVAQGSAAPNNLYGISSFTAYAMNPPGDMTGGNPRNCDGSVYSAAAPNGCNPPASDPPGTRYWRVCLQVITDTGIISGNAWGQYVSLLAMTRCVPSAAPGEPSGSGFQVFED